MCNGLVVGEITSSKGALPSASARGVNVYLSGGKERSEFPSGLSGSSLSYLGSLCPDHHATNRHWKSRSCSPLGNSIERGFAAEFDQINSFESLEHRLRCPRLSDSVRPLEATLPRARLKSEIQQGKEVKQDETPESRPRETRTAHRAWWHEARARWRRWRLLG